MNSELNTKLEELTKTLEDIGFKEFAIEIRQHDCTETQAQKIMRKIDKRERAICESFRGDDGEITDWLETTLRPFPNEIKIYCFYTPDEEAVNV